jgi:hypothetical protein
MMTDEREHHAENGEIHMDEEQTRIKKDPVVWVRLPRSHTVKELHEMGLSGAGCFGGDTCIVASSFEADAGIVVRPDLAELLKTAGLEPQDRCYGGGVCIA